MKQPNDLMQPRYKVIAMYPFSPHAIGAILSGQDGRVQAANVFGAVYFYEFDMLSDMPAIFQPLKWWEERTAEEMPEYVMHTKSGKVFSPFCPPEEDDIFGIKGESGWRRKDECEPATLEQYQTYKATNP